MNSNIDIYDFYYIHKAPVATRKHDLDEVIKLAFSTTSPIPTSIAIDIKNKEIYINPRFSTNGLLESKGTTIFNDKERLINILEKYSVQDWKGNYTTESPDSYNHGYGWSLLLQFEDGTTEEYLGQGTTDAIFPKEFEGFVEELYQLAKEIIGEDNMKDTYM
ncbi:hypothetical protein GGQ92_003015 [Gracilibacillus halotolerans]|uniref:Uncharacterized protein n=1 Tax=Gracilibacillus halotolerans TaxID=74386 RepID=A0A841RRF3_9BACI|nr:hypothetical protein [Gracilibacillus halotolerans]MBB6514193.1 hypothetical protein [Gracilibacillus halotolerans]